MEINSAGKIPTDLVLEWHALWAQVCDLHSMYRLYAGLYGNEQHRKLMDDIEPGVFLLLHRALQNAILTGFGRLLDPADSGGKRNLSLSRLLDIVASRCCPGLNDTLQTKLEEIKAHRAPIRLWRDKRVGHADKQTWLKIEKLPDIEQEAFERGLSMILDLLSRIHSNFNPDMSMPFLARVGDADALMGYLRDGYNARQAEIASEFP